jgi:hypothetical protein
MAAQLGKAFGQGKAAGGGGWVSPHKIDSRYEAMSMPSYIRRRPARCLDSSSLPIKF